MKKSSTLLAALLVFASATALSLDATAQARGHRTSEHSSKRTHRTTTTRGHKSHRSHRGHSSRHHSHHHKRHTTHHRGHHSGVHIQLGWGYPYYYYNHGYHHPHTTYRHSTVYYDRRPEVVIVEREQRFVMPPLECPIRTEEESAGLQQWCATSRGTKHGPFRRWYADGVLATQGEYDYDTKSGVWLEYHANGAIREEGAFKDGARIGTWITWGSDGEELVVVDY